MQSRELFVAIPLKGAGPQSALCNIDDTQIWVRQDSCIYKIMISFYFMTKLLELAIRRLRELPEDMQDSAARALILQMEEDPELGDEEAVDTGRQDIKRGKFVTLENWRNEMGLGDR
jgi:hypothetical protein